MHEDFAIPRGRFSSPLPLRLQPCYTLSTSAIPRPPNTIEPAPNDPNDADAHVGSQRC
jgi:hypothetical protein